MNRGARVASILKRSDDFWVQNQKTKIRPFFFLNWPPELNYSAEMALYTLTLPVKIAKLSFLLEKKKISRICFSVFAVAAKYVRMLIGFCSAYPGQHERIGNWHKKPVKCKLKVAKHIMAARTFAFMI